MMKWTEDHTFQIEVRWGAGGKRDDYPSELYWLSNLPTAKYRSGRLVHFPVIFLQASKILFENESPVGILSKLRFSCKHVYQIWQIISSNTFFNSTLPKSGVLAFLW